VLVLHFGYASLENRGGFPRLVLNVLGNSHLGVSFLFFLSGFILTHIYVGGPADQDVIFKC
jgi:peptidoglycan/LPS O-acetylase OafA/YrhL